MKETNYSKVFSEDNQRYKKYISINMKKNLTMLLIRTMMYMFGEGEYYAEE